MHDGCLLVTHVQSPGCFTSRRGQVIIILRRRVVLNAFIVPSDISFLSPKQLQHQYNQKNFSINLTVLCFNNPPQFFVFSVENLPDQLFIFLEGEFGTSRKVRSQINKLSGCVFTWWKEQVLKRIGQSENFVLLHVYLIE